MTRREASYFLPYQERWISDDSPLKLAEKSRRVGFTYASSYRFFQKCLLRKDGFTQWVSSRDMLTAQELITDYIAKWCRLGNVAAKGIYGEDAYVIDSAKDIRAFIVEFPTGSRLVSLSSTPEAFAGKGGDVFLDEVDLHKDAGRLIDMALPCTTWGGQLEAVSAYSVDGTKDTPWAQMITEARTENKQGASLHRVTIYDAVGEGLVEKINEATGQHETREGFIKKMRARCRTLAAWESQFECKVQDAGGRLLPTSLVAPCEMKAEEIAKIVAASPNAPRVAGYDVARHVHGAAWHEYALIGTTLFLARREVFHENDFDEQEKFIEAQMERAESRITRLDIDATGLGMQMAERMGKRYPGRVDEVNLESHRRHELCMLTRDKFLNRRIVIPEDPQLRADLEGPTISIATNGAMRVIVPQFTAEGGEQSHCDEFMATVLGVAASDAGGMPAPPPIVLDPPKMRDPDFRRL